MVVRHPSRRVVDDGRVRAVLAMWLAQRVRAGQDPSTSLRAAELLAPSSGTGDLRLRSRRPTRSCDGCLRGGDEEEDLLQPVASVILPTVRDCAPVLTFTNDVEIPDDDPSAFRAPSAVHPPGFLAGVAPPS